MSIKAKISNSGKIGLENQKIMSLSVKL